MCKYICGLRKSNFAEIMTPIISALFDLRRVVLRCSRFFAFPYICQSARKFTDEYLSPHDPQRLPREIKARKGRKSARERTPPHPTARACVFLSLVSARFLFPSSQYPKKPLNEKKAIDPSQRQFFYKTVKFKTEC